MEITQFGKQIEFSTINAALCGSLQWTGWVVREQEILATLQAYFL